MATKFHITLHRTIIFTLAVSGVGILLAAGIELLSAFNFLFPKTLIIVEFFNRTLFSFKVTSVSQLPRILGIDGSGEQSVINISFGEMFMQILLVMFLLSAILAIRNAGRYTYEKAVLRGEKAGRKEFLQYRPNRHTISNDEKRTVKRSGRRSR